MPTSARYKAARAGFRAARAASRPPRAWPPPLSSTRKRRRAGPQGPKGSPAKEAPANFASATCHKNGASDVLGIVQPEELAVAAFGAPSRSSRWFEALFREHYPPVVGLL